MTAPTLAMQQQAGNAMAPPAGTKPNEETSCVVCCDENRSHVLIPCGHLCLCAGCSEMLFTTARIVGETPLCPMCRAPCEHAMRIYT